MQKAPIKLNMMWWDAKKSDFEMAFKRYKDWSADVDQALGKVLDAAYEGFLTSVGMGTIADLLFTTGCVICRTPLPTPQSKFLSRCGDYKPLVQSFLVGGALEKANHIAIMRGCNASISYVMKNITGAEDVHTSMVAGFGYGVVISLVTGMRGPNVMSVGVMCALFNGVLFKASRQRQDKVP